MFGRCVVGEKEADRLLVLAQRCKMKDCGLVRGPKINIHLLTDNNICQRFEIIGLRRLEDRDLLRDELEAV
jgi:hypothetical protein